MDQEEPNAVLQKREFVPSSTRGYSHWLSVGLVVLLGGTMYVNVFIPSCCGSTEASAISSMRNIVTAQITYQATTGQGRYAPDLATLSAQRLIDSVLGSGTKSGYVFILSGEDLTFTATAAPQVPGETGNRSFFSDETSVIRCTTEDRPATAQDEPL